MTATELPSHDSSPSSSPGSASRGMSWLVGSAFSRHAQRTDYQNSTLLSPLLMGTSALSGTSAGLAMHEFMKVPPAVAVFGGLCAAFLYIAMDRTIIGIETRTKALRQAEREIMPADPQNANAGKSRKNWFRDAGHYLMLGGRIGVAVMFGFVTTEVLMTTKLFKDEIVNMQDERYRANNAEIVVKYDTLKAQYDDQTAALRAQLAELEADWTEQRRTSLAVDRGQLEGQESEALAAARQRLQTALGDKARVAEDLATQERARLAAEQEKIAEERGVAVGSASGVAGCGPRCEAAIFKMEAAESEIALLRTRQSVVDQTVAAAQQELAAIEARKEDDSAVMKDNASGLETLYASLKTEIDRRMAERSAAFAEMDKQMESDPNHIEKETGLLASLSALDQLLSKPENKGSPTLLYYALLLLLVGIETSPVLAAAMRPATRAEMRAAYDELVELGEHKAAAQQRLKILQKVVREEIAHLDGKDVVDRSKSAMVSTEGGYKPLALTLP